MIALLFAAVAVGAVLTVCRAGEKDGICDYDEKGDAQ